jgi:hypothetical protein
MMACKSNEFWHYWMEENTGVIIFRSVTFGGYEIALNENCIRKHWQNESATSLSSAKRKAKEFFIGDKVRAKWIKL